MLTEQVSVGVADPLLEFDAAAGQLLHHFHLPLRWQVLLGVLLAHDGVVDPGLEGFYRQCEEGGRSIWVLTVTCSCTMNVETSQEGLGWQCLRGW
jgi:hypothetical protein